MNKNTTNNLALTGWPFFFLKRNGPSPNISPEKWPIITESLSNTSNRQQSFWIRYDINLVQSSSIKYCSSFWAKRRSAISAAGYRLAQCRVDALWYGWKTEEMMAQERERNGLEMNPTVAECLIISLTHYNRTKGGSGTENNEKAAKECLFEANEGPRKRRSPFTFAWSGHDKKYTEK